MDRCAVILDRGWDPEEQKKEWEMRGRDGGETGERGGVVGLPISPKISSFAPCIPTIHLIGSGGWIWGMSPSRAAKSPAVLCMGDNEQGSGLPAAEMSPVVSNPALTALDNDWP